MDISLYAELLINIRQVTLLVILPSLPDEGTVIEVGYNQKSIEVHHQGYEEAIELPCFVDNKQNLAIPSGSSHELSFRLSVNTELRMVQRAASDKVENVPWPASKLTTQSKLVCPSCKTLLAPNIKTWKDLPSGGWADMMDFWHCHKPTSEDEAHQSTGENKGYAASNDLGPTVGTGLVDVSHFLLTRSDCTGVQVCIHFCSLLHSPCYNSEHPQRGIRRRLAPKKLAS